MRTRIISSLAAATLLLSACGGGASGPQGEAADLLIKSATDEGIDIDKGCAEDLANQLSDADAEKIVAADDGDTQLSPEGEALTIKMLSCVDIDSLVDSLIQQIGDQPGVDKDCLREVLKELDPEALAAGDIPDGIVECIDIGG